MRSAKIFFISFTLFVLSCASSRDGKIPFHHESVNSFKPINKTITVLVSYQLYRKDFSGEVKLSPSPLDSYVLNLKKSVKKAFKDSGLFNNVDVFYIHEKNITKQSDFLCEVNIIEKIEDNGISCISWGTLMLIPDKQTAYFTATTSFKKPDGKLIKSYSNTEVKKIWMNLFLVFYMPFAKSAKDEQIMYDFSMNSIVDAHKDGIF